MELESTAGFEAYCHTLLPKRKAIRKKKVVTKGAFGKKKQKNKNNT